MSQEGELSGYSTSASSDFGSLDERFKYPPVVSKSATKRRAPQNEDEQLGAMMNDKLVLSPEKRLRLNTHNDVNVVRRLDDDPEIMARKEGRPPTRRSNSRDMERSPRVAALRHAGSSMDMLRTESALCTDSISPKLISMHGGASPRRHSQLNKGGSVYSRHRLGSTFSPLVAGGRVKVATPSQTLRGLNRQSPSDSPRRGGLRTRGGVTRTPRLLKDRFNMLD
ncbi:unnamed protein product [Caenorhabditis nigoni]